MPKKKRVPERSFRQSNILESLSNPSQNTDNRNGRPFLGPKKRAQFSMEDEARNTQHNHAWSSDPQLWRSRIDFVSAGALEPTHSTNSRMVVDPTLGHTPVSDRVTPEERPISNNRNSSMAFEAQTSPMGKCSTDPDELSYWSRDTIQARLSTSERYVTLSEGKIENRLGEPNARTLSQRPSSSSLDANDEVVLFRGRNRLKQTLRHSVRDGLRPRSPWTLHQDSKTDDTATETSEVAEHHSSPTESNRIRSTSASQPIPLQSRKARTKKNQRHSPVTQCCDKNNLAKYQANVQGLEYRELQRWSQSPSLTLSNGLRDAGHSQSGKSEARFSEHYLSGAGVSCDLENLDRLNIADQSQDATNTVLSRRKTSTCTQYLVDSHEERASDPERMSQEEIEHTTHVVVPFSDSHQNHLEAAVSTSTASFETEDQAVHDLEEALGAMEGDEYFVSMCRARMTDEEVATRLAKQEELGLGSSELLLLDGSEEHNWAKDEEDKHIDIELFHQETHKFKRMTPQAMGAARDDSVLSTNSFLNELDSPYGDFDIMDRSRASISMSMKSKKHCDPRMYNISDRELQSNLLASWENDRLKKKARKQQREERRSKGTLDNCKSPMLGTKYPNGMSIDQVMDELKAFLQSEKQSITFVPMDKKHRAYLHTIAGNLGLKSQSQGNGRNRYPCLYKTSRTASYDEGLFQRINVYVARRFFPHLRDIKKSQVPRRKQGGTVSAAVSYRDGEIVGAAAPELGTDNRGRAMLEKMGWSSGTALGATNNKGMLLPVRHTVKNTRAGLG